MNMKKNIIKRLVQFIPVLIGITFLTFSLMYISPSNPASVKASAGGITPSKEVVEEIKEEMGLNRPFLVQYVSWLGNLAKGDMGSSYITDEPVIDKLMVALPYTLKMAFLSMAITLIFSVPLGVYMAAHKGGIVDFLLRIFAFIGNALPNFIIGIFLLYLCSYKLGLIPVLSTGGWIGVILPSLTLALVMSTRYIRQIRAATLDELSKDYVIGLRARGISEHNILFKNVLKNIMVTVITLTGISIGSLLGGTVVVEMIFNWPGLGHLVMEAIGKRDYPIVQGFVVWLSVAFMLVNLLTDISYTWFNPKIKEI